MPPLSVFGFANEKLIAIDLLDFFSMVTSSSLTSASSFSTCCY